MSLETLTRHQIIDVDRAEMSNQFNEAAEHDIRDHCGVMAIWDPANPHILDDAYIGALNVQHRGQGGAGIATICGSDDRIHLLRGAGEVTEVFGEDGSGMKLTMPIDTFAAMVHTRWPTDKANGDCNQPRVRENLALAHNGNLINTPKLAKSFGIEEHEYTNDTDLCTAIIDKVAAHYNGDVEKAVKYVAPHLEGAFNITILTKDKLIAIRDRNGLRPFQMGTTETGGVIVASENMAIDNVTGAKWVREVEPAEILVVDADGPRSELWADPEPAACLMEYLYLGNKDTMLNGIRLGAARRGFGREFVKRIPPELLAKLAGFIPVPNGANQVTHGLSEATKIPYVPLLILNPAIKYGRSFIQPNGEQQFEMADGKHVVDNEVVPQVEGKVMAEVDDTLVRANTQKAVVPKIKEGGKPAELHVFIPAPKYIGTCDLGVDTPDREELIAVRHDGDEEAISKEIEVDSTIYATREDMQAVVGKNACMSCFGGQKPEFIRKAEAKRNEPAEDLMPALVPVGA